MAVAESYCVKRRWTGLYTPKGQLLQAVEPHIPFFLDISNWIDFVSIIPVFATGTYWYCRSRTQHCPNVWTD